MINEGTNNVIEIEFHNVEICIKVNYFSSENDI